MFAAAANRGDDYRGPGHHPVDVRPGLLQVFKSLDITRNRFPFFEAAQRPVGIDAARRPDRWRREIRARGEVGPLRMSGLRTHVEFDQIRHKSPDSPDRRTTVGRGSWRVHVGTL